MTQDRTVLQFIKRFRCPGTIRVFTQGCCYWFAFILKERFHGTIMYHEVDNHFACLISKRLYDITGPIGSQLGWQEWERYKFYEPANANRVIRDCLEIVTSKGSSQSNIKKSVKRGTAVVIKQSKHHERNQQTHRLADHNEGDNPGISPEDRREHPAASKRKN